MNEIAKNISELTKTDLKITDAYFENFSYEYSFELLKNF